MSNNMGTDKISKLFIRMVIPSVISQLIVLVYNMVDRIFIGHIPEIGSIALTGIGICMPVTLIVSAFGQLMGVGGAPKASMALGRNDKEEAEKILGVCTFGLVAVSILLTVIGLWFSKEILLFFGASSNTLPYAMEYLKVYMVGTVFVELTIGLTAFITAQGFTTVTMIAVLLGAGLNIILDPICIFTLNLGVKGAAIASVLSQIVSVIIAVAFLTRKNQSVKLRLQHIRFDFKCLCSCMALGLSPCMMVITESFVSIAFNRSLLQYGGDLAVGSMAIFSTVMQIVTLPLQGFSQGAQPITSYNYGAGNWKRVSENFKLLFGTSVIYACLLWGIILFLPKIFISLFTNDTGLIDYSVKMIRVYFAILGITGVQYACQNTFLALGNARVSVFLAILRKVILLLPLIFILPHIMPNQVMAVFLAEPIADTLAGSTTLILFLKEYKKAIL
ncbi:MAG: MATE family efflux transporter [Lachnospiraceae bacterium]|nr:MATE family efflux transporter [Lachnospiraceae bacterium]